MKSLILITLYCFIITPLQAKTVLIVGDSLSAAYGMKSELGWVNLLQQRVKPLGYDVINISAAGDTSSNGLNKIAPALQRYHPNIVIIQLGANDGLRGLQISQLKTNLNKMITMSLTEKSKVLLIATRLPPNYGSTYIKQFRQTYTDLATQYKLPIVTTFLNNIAGHDELLQQDKLHPSTKAQPLLLDNIWPTLKPML